jgi:hypothetical protein
MSFAASTLVSTPAGLRAIALLKVGDHVTAYDPATGKASTQTVQQTYMHHDANLLAVTLRAVTSVPTTNSAATESDKQREAVLAAHRAHAPPSTTGATTASTPANETILTTTNHPWLTADHGWILASFLRLGEPVQRVDGGTAIVVAVTAEPGAASMWDLTVSNVHTFAVGSGAFVVHNCPDEVRRYEGKKPEYQVHPDRAKGADYNPRKTPVPGDAEDVYKHAVPDDPDNPRHWYGRNANGDIYQYHGSNDGFAHFSARSDVPPGIRGMTNYARGRLGLW